MITDGTAVEAIIKAARENGQVVTINGVEYYVHGSTVQLPEKPDERLLPAPTALGVHTLSGIRDYVVANRDAVNLEKCVIQVVSPTEVRLLGPLVGHRQQRFVYAEAKAYDRMAGFQSFKFGQFLDVETMVVGIQVLFDAHEGGTNGNSYDEVLRLLSSVKAENVGQSEDDGISQSVVVSQGLSLAKREDVKNPVQLYPFRTFPEVAQPGSPYILRLRINKEQGSVSAALFEADGGAWRDEATDNIKAWLQDNVANVSIIS